MHRNLFILCSLLALFVTVDARGQETDPKEKRQIDFAIGLYQRGDYREAAAEFETYLKNPQWNSRREVALFFSGESHRQLKESGKAEAAYTQFLKEYPDSQYVPIATYRLAEIHLDRKQGPQAASLLKPLLDKDLTPDIEESVYYALGLASSLAGNSDEAIGWWEKGRAKFPNGPTDLQISLGIGVEAFRLGQWETAQKELSRWIGASEPSGSGAYPDALSKLAETYENLERGEEAKQTWLKLAEVTKDSNLLERALLSAAKNAFRLEQWAVLDQLAPRLAATIHSPPSRFQMNLLYGNRFYREKEWKRAAGYYSKALEEMESLPIGKPEEKQSLQEETAIRYGWCLFALEDWQGLQGALQPLADSQAKNPELLYLLGEAWKGQGNATEAIRWFSAVPESAEISATAKRNAADLAYASEDWERVSDLYLALAQKNEDPEEKIFYRLRAADGARKLDRFDQAAALYAEVKVDSSSETVKEKASYLEGWSLQRAGNLNDAIKALEEFRSSYPKSEFLPEGLFLLGQSYEKTGKTELAIPVLENLNGQFPDNLWTAEGLLILAGAYSKKGDYGKVLETLVTFQKRFPEKEMNKAYALWLAKALTDRARYEEALATLRALDPGQLNGQELEERQFLLAENLRKTKNYDEAVKAYQLYLEKFSGGRHLAAVHLGLGIATKQMGQGEEAKRHSNEALQLLESGQVADPAIEAQIYLLAGDLAFEAGDYDSAYRYYAKPSILVRHPVFTPLALAKSAECKEKLGETEKAKSLREELLRDFPDSEPAKGLSQGAPKGGSE
ncbi:MAG: tetratricopeptide repeat protein [Candidatus Omnitrophica bacterium]|nr:tetratricopeptide repeat protein [Candidatus Omnitrophota bacterium]